LCISVLGAGSKTAACPSVKARRQMPLLMAAGAAAFRGAVRDGNGWLFRFGEPYVKSMRLNLP
jgi:hypothetical protein